MQRFSWGAACVALLAVLLLAGCGAPKKPTGVVARVNGTDIKEADFNRHVRIMGFLLGQNLQSPEAKAQVLEMVITLEVLGQEAVRRGLKVDDAKVKAEAAEIMKSLGSARATLTEADVQAFIHPYLMRQALVEELHKGVTIGDGEVLAYYEQHKASEYTFAAESVRARHILMKEPEKALALHKQIEGGADFSALAKEHSIDTGSATQGGDLGYFTQDQMVPEFAAVAFSLRVGEVSLPVQSQYGWHLIKVEDRQPAGTLPFEAVQDRVKQEALLEKQEMTTQSAMTELMMAAKIETFVKF